MIVSKNCLLSLIVYDTRQKQGCEKFGDFFARGLRGMQVDDRFIGLPLSRSVSLERLDASATPRRSRIRKETPVSNHSGKSPRHPIDAPSSRVLLWVGFIASCVACTTLNVHLSQ